MNQYQRLDGTITTQEDDQRGIWYVVGPCGYWTDDWSKLKTTNRIPTCPGCGAVGFQTTFREWIAGAKSYELTGKEKYVEFVLAMKEKCEPRTNWLRRYYQWKQAKE